MKNVSQLAVLLSEVAKMQAENERLKALLSEAAQIVNRSCVCSENGNYLCAFCQNWGSCESEQFVWRKAEEVKKITEEQE